MHEINAKINNHIVFKTLHQQYFEYRKYICYNKKLEQYIYVYNIDIILLILVTQVSFNMMYSKKKYQHFE